MNLDRHMIENYPSLKPGTAITLSELPEEKRHPTVSFSLQKAFHFLSRLPGVYRRPLVCLPKLHEDYLDDKYKQLSRTDEDRQMGLPRKVAREVGSFRDPLSNFWPTLIWCEGILWPSREHYIASCKVMLTSGPVGSTNTSLRGAYDKIINYCKTRNWDPKRADTVKRAGKDLVNWDKMKAWEDCRDMVVRKALLASAFQDIKFLEYLLDPSVDVFHHIVEGQSLDKQHPYWCWGYNPKGNKNQHGKLLMQVRAQVVSMAQWLASYMKKPIIYKGKKEIYFGSGFDRKSLCTELRWVLTYTYSPRGYEGAWMFKPYEPPSKVTTVMPEQKITLQGSRPKPRTATATVVKLPTVVKPATVMGPEAAVKPTTVVNPATVVWPTVPAVIVKPTTVPKPTTVVWPAVVKKPATVTKPVTVVKRVETTKAQPAVKKVTKAPTAVKRPTLRVARTRSVIPMAIETVKSLKTIHVLPPHSVTKVTPTIVTKLQKQTVLVTQIVLAAASVQVEGNTPPSPFKKCKKVTLVTARRNDAAITSLPRRKKISIRGKKWSQIQSKINRDLSHMEVDENPKIDLLEEQQRSPRSAKTAVKGVQRSVETKSESTSELLADMAAMAMKLDISKDEMEVDGEEPDWNLQLERLNLLPSKSTQEGSFCTSCGKTFATCNFRKHVFGVHLPWFINTAKSCWTCGMVFRQNKPLQIHLGKHHGHQAWDKTLHLTPWACYTQGLFELLASFYGCKDLNEFYQAIVPQQDPNRYLKIWDVARTESNTNFLHEDWRRIMHLPQQECTLDPPNCIAALVHYRTILNLTQGLSEIQKGQIKNFNEPILMKDLGKGAKTPVTYRPVPVSSGNAVCIQDSLTSVPKPAPVPIEIKTTVVPTTKRLGEELVQLNEGTPVKKQKVSTTKTLKKKAPRAITPTVAPQIDIVDVHLHWDMIKDQKPSNMSREDVMSSHDIRYNLKHCLPCYCYPYGWIPCREHLPPPANKIALGWHPNRFPDYKNKDGIVTPYYASFKQFLKLKHVIAMGEIGLDYDRAGRDRSRVYHDKDGVEERRKQKELLHNILTATDRYLPIIVHCRENYRNKEKKFQIPKAYLDCITIFKQYLKRDHEIYLHCFDGDLEMWQAWNAAFDKVHLGINLMAASTRAHPGTRAVIKNVRSDRYMLETDSPYIKSPFRPKDEFPLPWMVVDVAHYVATVRNCKVEEVLRETTKAAGVFFKWD